MALLDEQTILLALVFVNAMTYTFFFIGLKRNWASRVIRATTIDEAFHELETSLRRAFPDLYEGFTWGEAISRAKTVGASKIDWSELDRELRKYEAHRFGGQQIAKFNVREILKLAAYLRQRNVTGKRSRDRIGTGSQVQSHN